ncbi:MAG: outer membrane beta-barrel protein [Deltaproteobacteria bacterium]|nr:outer membrane beta-barrel protein [Deltaproteobacteria bacterium]
MFSRITLATLALLGLSTGALAATDAVGQDDLPTSERPAPDAPHARSGGASRSSSSARPASSSSRSSSSARPASSSSRSTSSAQARPTQPSYSPPASRPSYSQPAPRPAQPAYSQPSSRPALPAARPSYSQPSSRPAAGAAHVAPADYTSRTTGQHQQPAHASSSHQRPASASHYRPASASHQRPASASHYRPSTGTYYSHYRPGYRSYYGSRAYYGGYYYGPRYASGVFVYGPRPVYHEVYVNSPQQQVQEAHLPDRHLNREDTLAVGLRLGTVYGGYDYGYAFGDAGIGLVVRARPVEAFGLEYAVTKYDQSFDSYSERVQAMHQASAVLYAFPWAKVSPYVLGGLTYTERSVDAAGLASEQGLVGPHVGAGLEFALGDSLALDLDARYVSYLNVAPMDPTVPLALQTSAGLVIHF